MCISLRRGLFALLILFSGQCEKPIGRISTRELPTFLVYAPQQVFHSFIAVSGVHGLCLGMKPIGILIKEELERQERGITWFANKLSCDRSNVYRLFQKESIDTNLLARISLILGRNFFAELSEYIQRMEETTLVQNSHQK